MGDSALENRVNLTASAHFWVSSYPFFETTLFVCARPETPFGEVQLYFYDADGELFNEAALACAPGEVGVIELSPFLGACKVESGLKHAHLEIRCKEPIASFCRLHNNLGATVEGEPYLVSAHSTGFFPILIGEGRNSMLGLVNHARAEVRVRCRLYLGKRMPEIQVLVPALGSRVVCLAAEFEEYRAAATSRAVPGYVRISSSAELPCGVQLIEAINAENGSYILSSVS